MTVHVPLLRKPFVAATMLLAAVATAGCQQLRYEPHLALRQLSRERTQPYYHSATTGEIVIKHPHRLCPTAGPPYFGFEPTCWNPWPADWVGCPHPEFCDCPTPGVPGPTPVDPPSPQAEPLPAAPADPPGNQERTGSVLVPAPDAAAMVQPPRAASDPTSHAPRIVAFTPSLASDRLPAPMSAAQDLSPVPVHQADAEVDDVDAAVVTADQDSHVAATDDGGADATESEESETSSEAEEIENDVDQGPVVMIEDGDDTEDQDDLEDSRPADGADLVETDNGELADDAATAEPLDAPIGANEVAGEGACSDAEERTVSAATAPKVAEIEAPQLVLPAAEIEVTVRPAPTPIAGLALPTEIAAPTVPQRETAPQMIQRPQGLPVTTLWSRSSPSVTAAGLGSLRFAGAEPARAATPEETKAALRFRSPSLPQANGAASRISLRPSGTGPTTSVQLVR